MIEHLKLMQGQNHMLTYILGAAGATTILSALFLLANNYVVNKIGYMVSEKLNTFREEMVTSLKEDYVTRKEVDVMVVMQKIQSSYISRTEMDVIQSACRESRERQEAELGRIWSIAQKLAEKD